MLDNNLNLELLKELLNVSVGKSAKVLNTLISKHIRLQVPDVLIVSLESLDETLLELKSQNIASVGMDFADELRGSAMLLFPSEDANLLVDIFMENIDADDYAEAKQNVLSEVGNIVLNALMGSVANMVNTTFEYKVPVYKEGRYEQIFETVKSVNHGKSILARTQFLIEELNLDGDFILFLEIGSYDKLIELIKNFEKKY